LLPDVPRLEGLGVFELQSWMLPLTGAVFVAMGLAAIGRWALALPWKRPRVTLVVTVLPTLLAAWMYLPFCLLTYTRIDRIQGRVPEPFEAMRSAGVSAIVTLLLAAAFLGVTQQRRTPAATRAAAQTVAVTLGFLLAHFSWILMVFPLPSYEWWPASREELDRFVPFRPCRGAMVWAVTRGPYREGADVYPFARIDDVWSRFIDPRLGRARVRAVSVTGVWEEGYLWLTAGDVEELRVRDDDPAVRRCDSRPRPEVVAAANWHRLGAAVERWQ
jgi:hypothetical protein